MTQEKTILVMDDDDAYLEVMQEVLDCLGYSSIFAKNGEEALVVYKKAKESNKSLAAAYKSILWVVTRAPKHPLSSNGDALNVS